jgi:peptidylprolyl isomerase
MNRTAAIISLVFTGAIVQAQTKTQPAPQTPPAAHKAAPSATATHPAAHPATPASTGVKLPPGIPPAKGPVVTGFSLRWQDITVGTGPDAEPGKIYKVHYTGWLASDGHKFDSSYDHPGQPVRGKDGNFERDEKSEVKLGPSQPLSFPQGMGRLIPGFDQGFGGMKVGGKRRIFIPWQLAYGAQGRPGPDAAHPGIPPKADLIFDVELVDQTEFTMPPGHPGMAPAGAAPHPDAPAHSDSAQPQTSQPATTQPK